MRRVLLAIVVALAWPALATAQDLFEIQVYPYDTVEAGQTMVELHSNFIPSGTTTSIDGLYPNHHQWHETVEITRGFNAWFETGFYVETAPYVPGEGFKFAGWHIRPRLKIPQYKTFPFHVSISFEYAFNQRGFDPNQQTLEVRPILERQAGRLYFSLNPSLSVATKGPEAGSAPGFEPSLKIGWDFTKQVNAGVEYYAETGPVKHFDPWSDEHHIIFPALDLNVSPDWELNFGVGRGLTGTSEHWIVKAIVGRRFKL